MADCDQAQDQVFKRAPTYSATAAIGIPGSSQRSEGPIEVAVAERLERMASRTLTADGRPQLP